MVEVKNLTKKYNKSSETVLSHISFQIKKGTIAVLLGANGAGKTTLIKILSGLINSTDGIAYINQEKCSISNPFIKRLIGVIYSNEQMYLNLTAKENIEYYASLHGVSSSVQKTRLKLYSNLFELDHFINKKVKELSQGMKQRVLITRALMHDPEILLLDEVTTGLDINSRYQMVQFLIHCKENNKTILISTHHINEFKFLIDQVLILNNGRLILNELLMDKTIDIEKMYIELIK